MGTEPARDWTGSGVLNFHEYRLAATYCKLDKLRHRHEMSALEIAVPITAPSQAPYHTPISRPQIDMVSDRDRDRPV